eukprot:TRINITY_DN4489_c0_g3_i1.p1 TRINITY_DN4489_c0_g3~~TRINITY_DN4489_c0_g3_i1.p1  ORF type:complete len:486 (+),score=63.06 TRINITY_DN4489_c0_g3_i1:155-1612(+)
MCCKGLEIKLGLLCANFPPYWSCEHGSLSGFFVDFWQQAVLDMGASPKVVTSSLIPPSPITTADFSDTDVHVFVKSAEYMYTQRGADELVVTASVLDSYYKGVTLKVSRPAGPFRLFDPFAIELWLANLSCFFSAALLLIIFNAIAPSEEFVHVPLKKRLHLEWVSLSFYHMCAMFLSGEDYEFATWPQRILRVGLLFVVLVSSASYTANLAAFFTAPSFNVLGPKDMGSLSSSNACTTWNLDLKALEPFVASVTAMPDAPPELGIVRSVFERQDYCLEKLKKHEVDVWLVGELEARLALQARGCDEYALQDNIAVATVSLGFALPRQNASLARSLSASIVHLKNSPAGARLMARHFNVGQQICADKAISDTTPLSLESQRGLFYIFLVTSGIATLVAVAQAGCRSSQLFMPADGSEKKSKQVEHTMTEGEMLRMLLKRMETVTGQDEPAKSHGQPSQGLGDIQAWSEKRLTNRVIIADPSDELD